MKEEWRSDVGREGDLPPWVKDALGGDAPAQPPSLPPGDSDPPPPVGPPPQIRRRKWPVIVGVVGLLLAVGVVARLAGSSSGGGEPAVAITAAEVKWAVGACVKQVSGPTAYPTDLPVEQRFVWDMQRQYGPVACTDPAAEGKVTAAGPTHGPVNRNVTLDDCPEGTDFTYDVTPNRLSYQIWCGVSLKSPRPSDPGQGGGRLVDDDCVRVRSNNPAVRNDVITEVPCAWPHYAKVLAHVPDRKNCPSKTLSPLPRDGKTLCLGRGERGQIPAPGDCVDYPSSFMSLLWRAGCDKFDAYRFVSTATSKTGCRQPLSPFEVTGYIGYVCLRRI